MKLRRRGSVPLLKHSACALLLAAALWAAEWRTQALTPTWQKKTRKAPATEAAQTRSVSVDSMRPMLERLAERYRARPYTIPPTARSSNMLQWARSPQGMQVWHRPEATVYNQLKRGVAAVEPPEGQTMLAKFRQGETPSRLALRFIGENPTIFRINDPTVELVEYRRTTDVRGATHLFFQQYHQGVPLWGRQLVAHVDAAGALRSINCLIEPSPRNIYTKPQVSAHEAIALAYKQLQADGAPLTLTARQAATYRIAPDSARLHYWQTAPRTAMALAWVVEVRPNLRDWMRFFIRADDGKILEHYNATKSDGPVTAQSWNLKGQLVTINTYEIDGSYYMLDGSRPMFAAGQTSQELLDDPQGVIGVFDLRNQDATSGADIFHFSSADNIWSDPASVSALDHGGLIYQFFYELGGGLSRNSLDNAGKSMMMLLHVTSDGEPMDNAFWNGSFVGLGDGNIRTTSWPGALDFIAHEFTHAHVQYTANLEYKFQSGALNETYADIGAVSVDDANYTLGEEIAILQYFPTGALRDMSDPHNGGTGPGDLDKGWQPAHMNEYIDLTLEEDNGGVHINNGITNHAAFKILDSLGRDQGEQVLFHALYNRLIPQANFVDFRLAAVASAGELFGAESAQQEAVKTAFDEVGIVEGGGGTRPPDDRPVVTGEQYILIVNDVPIDENTTDNSLFLTAPFATFSELLSGGVFSQLTLTQINIASGRPIAIDAYGQDIFFIDADHHLRAIYPSGAGEVTFSTVPEWWSAAISPNGQRLAMTTDFVENIIYIFDFGKDPVEVTELILQHPTTDPNNAYSDIVLFADVLVFLDDQLLVYDTLNSIDSPGEVGETIDFWDVNAVDVVSGQIFAVLPPQSAGVSVANPIIASTNNSILAVEMFGGGQPVETIGINLYSGEQNSIYFNNQQELTFPDYSVDDDYMLYSLTELTYGTKDVYFIPLGEDKISQVGSGEVLVIEAQLPLWFGIGEPPTSVIGFEKPNSRAAETAETAHVAVVLSQASTTDTVTVDYAVTGGNAIGGGVDYTLENGRLTFNPGVTERFIDITIIDDGAPEENETIVLTLSRPVNTWLSDADKHTHTIAAPLFTAVSRRNPWHLYR